MGGNYFTNYLKPSKHWLVWDKQNPNLSFAEGELAWVRDGKLLRIFHKYSVPTATNKKIHPTQKPVELYEWLLQNYAKQGDKILDTHVGSGSSLIACGKYKHDYVGFEIDEDYYRMAKKRIEEELAQMTIWDLGLNPYQE